MAKHRNYSDHVDLWPAPNGPQKKIKGNVVTGKIAFFFLPSFFFLSLSLCLSLSPFLHAESLFFQMPPYGLEENIALIEWGYSSNTQLK